LPYEGDLETVAAAVEKNRPEATEPRVVVSEGDWVLLRTTDGAHALLQIRSIEGNSDDDKTVTFFYAYSSLTDRVMF